jgi:PAS domain-containing protein
MPELAEAITSRRDLSVEANLRAAFELSPTVLTITADGRFVDLNDGFVRLHGYAREDDRPRGLGAEPHRSWTGGGPRAGARGGLRSPSDQARRPGRARSARGLGVAVTRLG